MSHISQIKVGDTTSTISVPYGTCATAAATVAKTVAITGFTQDAGTSVRVKFTYANSAANPTLNINSQGAKPIVGYGTIAPTTSWKAGSIVDFTYDGTSWVMTGFGAIAEVARAVTTLTSAADQTNAKLTFTAGNNQSTGFVTGSNSTATKTVTLTADGAKVIASDGTNSVEKLVASMTLPTSAATTADGTNKATISRSTSDQYINIPTGYNSSKASYKVNAVANGTEGTPTASVTTTGSSSNNYTARVTPKVTNTTGYITATSGGKSGTAISVTPTNLGLTKQTALSVVGDTVSIPAGSYTEGQLTATVEMQDAEYAPNVVAAEYSTGGVPLVSMPGYTGNKQLDYLNIPAGTSMSAGINVDGEADITNNSSGSMVVSNAGTITSLSSSNKITTQTNTGTISTLTNNKTITALNNTGSISTTSLVGTLTNGVYATITTINNAATSSTIKTINNSGAITTINNNSSTVGAFNNKAGASVTNINNSGTVTALTNAGNITRSFNGMATSTSDYTYGVFGTIDNTCGTIDINNIGFSDADGALNAVVTVSNVAAKSTWTKTKVTAQPSTNNSSDRRSITRPIAENKVFSVSPFAGGQTYKTVLSASSNKYVWIKSSATSTTSAPIIACAATTGQKTITTNGVCLSTATTSTQLGTAAGSVASFFVIGPSTTQYYVGLSSSTSAAPTAWSSAFYLGTTSANRYGALVSLFRILNNKTEVYCTLPVSGITLDS